MRIEYSPRGNGGGVEAGSHGFWTLDRSGVSPPAAIATPSSALQRCRRLRPSWRRVRGLATSPPASRQAHQRREGYRNGFSPFLRKEQVLEAGARLFCPTSLPVPFPAPRKGDRRRCIEKGLGFGSSLVQNPEVSILLVF
ncbi:hypothetical protein MUK42_07772 [Musa troglodytarum]|uniref:Uncharacterized protein n=1 Tax=Musa troglodytarum TaxID=320322 RepID=A0A9E7H0D8_9LILI|nr:hypothetical protein MUK42_07772 [Musa troglodytarum]